MTYGGSWTTTTHRQTNAQIGKYTRPNIHGNLDRVRVIHSFISNFISDHRIVEIEHEIRKQLEKCQSTKHRNYRDFNLNNFSEVFNNNKILDQSSLEEAMQAFNEEMGKTLIR